MEPKWIPKNQIQKPSEDEGISAPSTEVTLDFGTPPDDILQTSQSPSKLHTIPPVSSIHTKNTEETIALLEQMLAQTRTGHLIGLACVSLHRDSTYSLKLSGEARSESEQMSVAGMLAALQKMVLENH